MSVTVHSQTELDQAIEAGEETIHIDSPADTWLAITTNGPADSRLILRDSSHAELWNSSHAMLWDSSHAVLRGSSHAVLWESSHAVLRDSTHAELSGSSHAELRDSSHAVLRGSSHAVLWGSSHAELRDSTHAELRGSSRAVLWGSSHAELWGSSHAETTRYAVVHLRSQQATFTGDGHLIDLTGIDLTDPATWCEFNGVTTDGDGIAYMYKAVGDDWKSGYGTAYPPGSTPEAPDWDAGYRNCGRGLHFCASPLLSFGYKPDATKFLKAGVRLDEMVTLDDKVKARRVFVPCVEVDRYGQEILPDDRP